MDKKRKQIVKKQHRSFACALLLRLALLALLVAAAYLAGCHIGGERMRKAIYNELALASGDAVDISGQAVQGAQSMTTQPDISQQGKDGTETDASPGRTDAADEGGGLGGVSGNDSLSDAGGADLSWIWEEMPLLLLVNKEYKLPDDYELKLLKMPDGTNRASELAYQPLNDMLKAGRKEGLRFEICSSYRSVERQQELLDEDIDALMRQGYTYDEAYEEVTRETMPPGYSEHSTGLAFDIVSLDYQMLDDKQASTKECLWLQEHCQEYGFILRYPQGKEDITGIDYEPWHFRYVGVEAATYIMENDLTLEEYLEELAKSEKRS